MSFLRAVRPQRRQIRRPTWVPSKAVTNTALVVADGTHAHAGDNVVLTQAHTLAVADGQHAHSTDAIALTQAHTLVVADATHAHAGDNVVLTQAHTLVVAEATHAHAADNLTITTAAPGDTSLTVADATHAHAGDNVSLIPILAVADATHAHAADNLTLTQAHTLVVADATDAHAGDNVVIIVPDAYSDTYSNSYDTAVPNSLVIGDGLHGHTADGLTLTQAHTLTGFVDQLDHTADNIDFVQDFTGAVNDGLHANRTDNVALTQQHSLTVAETRHTHTADALFIGFVFIIADCAHAHRGDGNIVLGSGELVRWVGSPRLGTKQKTPRSTVTVGAPVTEWYFSQPEAPA